MHEAVLKFILVSSFISVVNRCLENVFLLRDKCLSDIEIYHTIWS